MHLLVISLLAVCPLLLLASVSTPLRSRVTANDKSNVVKNEDTQKHDVKSDAGESQDETDQSRSCPTCGKEDSTEEEAKLLRIEMFKQTLIKELHLDPNDLHANTSEKTPGFDIRKLPPLTTDYTLQDVPAYDAVNAETLEITIPGTYLGRQCRGLGRHDTGCATFDLRDQIKQDISGAELWLYKVEDRNDMAGQTLDVYELNLTSRDTSRIENLVSRREFFVKEGWLSTDLTGTVKQWLQEGNDNPVLAFNCTTCKTRSYKALYGIKHLTNTIPPTRFM